MASQLTDMLPADVGPDDVLYIVDKQLEVVYTNEAWTKFASKNNGAKLLGEGWDANLLENMRGKEKERWRHIYRLLLEGRVPHHKEDFTCSSPVEKRIYQLRITPQKDRRGHISWLVHHTLALDETQKALDQIGGRLGRMDDPQRVTREYRQRIIKRRIRIPGFRTACHLMPLEKIGGDLLWHREFPQGAAHLTHADVMGHGAAAGRCATEIAIILDEITDVAEGPSALVSTLNQVLIRLAADDVKFATGLFFKFDHSGQILTCANFGHHSPIFSRTGQVSIDSGPPRGAGPGSSTMARVPHRHGRTRQSIYHLLRWHYGAIRSRGRNVRNRQTGSSVSKIHRHAVGRNARRNRKGIKSLPRVGLGEG